MAGICFNLKTSGSNPSPAARRYRGHAVLQTLIRAYFSPLATTGQRYIYSGSADGSVYIWGEEVSLIICHPCSKPLH